GNGGRGRRLPGLRHGAGRRELRGALRERLHLPRAEAERELHDLGPQALRPEHHRPSLPDRQSRKRQAAPHRRGHRSLHRAIGDVGRLRRKSSTLQGGAVAMKDRRWSGWARTAWLGMAAGLALILTGDQGAQTAMLVGIDPLEAMNSRIKPNIMIVVDTSGS